MIKLVESKLDILKFCEFGVDCSRYYPNGITKLLSEELDLFDSDKNYILRDGGKISSYLFINQGVINGRIAAMITHLQPKQGFIGFFDCEDNQHIANELINSALKFLIENGCQEVVAPVNFSIYHSYRFMTSGFSEKAFVGEPRNMEYYPTLFSNFGFSVSNTWESRIYELDDLKNFNQKNKVHGDSFTQLGYRFEKLTDSNSLELMKKTYQILIQSYSVFPLFTPISEADFLVEYRRMPQIIDRDCSLFVYNPKGEFLGFYLVIKDLAVKIAAMKGKADLLSKMKFLIAKDHHQIANIAQGGTLPYFIREAAVLGKKELGTPLNLTDAVAYHANNEIIKKGVYQKLMFSLVREKSFFINHLNDYSSKREYSIFKLNLG